MKWCVDIGLHPYTVTAIVSIHTHVRGSPSVSMHWWNGSLKWLNVFESGTCKVYCGLGTVNV